MERIGGRVDRIRRERKGTRGREIISEELKKDGEAIKYF